MYSKLPGLTHHSYYVYDKLNNSTEGAYWYAWMRQVLEVKNWKIRSTFVKQAVFA